MVVIGDILSANHSNKYNPLFDITAMLPHHFTSTTISGLSIVIGLCLYFVAAFGFYEAIKRSFVAIIVFAVLVSVMICFEIGFGIPVLVIIAAYRNSVLAFTVEEWINSTPTFKNIIQETV